MCSTVCDPPVIAQGIARVLLPRQRATDAADQGESASKLVNDSVASSWVMTAVR